MGRCVAVHPLNASELQKHITAVQKQQLSALGAAAALTRLTKV